MPEPEVKSQRTVSLDIYAVALALIVALLVRFNLLPKITW